MNRTTKENKSTSIDENNVANSGMDLDKLSSLYIFTNTLSLNMASAFKYLLNLRDPAAGANAIIVGTEGNP